MQRVCGMLLSTVLGIASSGCGTLMPDSSISVDPSISRSDVSEIERLLPVVGVRHPISGITQVGPEEYGVECHGRQLSEWQYEIISFTVLHKNGRWFADRSSIHRSVGTIVE